MNKELSIGEVGTIHGKTVLCAEVTAVHGRRCMLDFCFICAFKDMPSCDCPPCLGDERTDGNNVYYPEITKGL